MWVPKCSDSVLLVFSENVIKCFLCFLQDLKDLMRKVGEVTFVDAHRTKKNEGVVEFSSHSDMKNAIDKLDGTDLNGRKLKLYEDRKRDRSRSRSRSRSSSRSRSPSRSRTPERGSKRSRSRSVSRTPEKKSTSNRSPSRSPSPPRKQSRSRSASAESQH